MKLKIIQHFINILNASCRYPIMASVDENTYENYNLFNTLENLDDVRKIILDILEKLVTTGIDKDSKCLGAFYVIGALTLVNNDAATSLPWLFEAAYHM